MFKENKAGYLVEYVIVLILCISTDRKTKRYLTRKIISQKPMLHQVIGLFSMQHNALKNNALAAVFISHPNQLKLIILEQTKQFLHRWPNPLFPGSLIVRLLSICT